MDGQKTILWEQLGASLDMLEHAMQACPDGLWVDRTHRPQFWFLVYHALALLDEYLARVVDGSPLPLPFALDPRDPETPGADRPYTKEELIVLLVHGREQGRAATLTLTDRQMSDPASFGPGVTNAFELVIYTTRHLQHHVGQLQLLLRQHGTHVPAWIGKTKRALRDG